MSSMSSKSLPAPDELGPGLYAGIEVEEGRSGGGGSTGRDSGSMELTSGGGT